MRTALMERKNKIRYGLAGPQSGRVARSLEISKPGIRDYFLSFHKDQAASIESTLQGAEVVARFTARGCARGRAA